MGEERIASSKSGAETYLGGDVKKLAAVLLESLEICLSERNLVTSNSLSSRVGIWLSINAGKQQTAGTLVVSQGTRQHKGVEKLKTVRTPGVSQGTRQHKRVEKLKTVRTLGVSQRDKTAQESREAKDCENSRGVTGDKTAQEIREAKDCENSRVSQRDNSTRFEKLEIVETLGVSQRDKTARDSRS
ncbi:hypothetical protein RRG08_045589 [Elysia crispata]|uniref:Uncharacterized protein n=1 Tax=Elysia crispata TaxID=231223 RepID=A0AAE1AE28_9GAST|nr:hypothetical protein RRG08_045589 [Elysia crispata]